MMQLMVLQMDVSPSRDSRWASEVSCNSRDCCNLSMEGNEIRVFSLQIIVEDAKVQVHNLPDGKVSLEGGVRSERIREPGMGDGANG